MPHPNATHLSLPMFGHKVRAGFPSPADDYVEAWLDLNEHLVENKDATFFVQATGDSMTGAGIQEGNLLVVDRALEAIFDRWRRFDPVRQAHARAALGRIAAAEDLAKDVAEVVGNALKA